MRTKSVVHLGSSSVLGPLTTREIANAQFSRRNSSIAIISGRVKFPDVRYLTDRAIRTKIHFPTPSNPNTSALDFIFQFAEKFSSWAASRHHPEIGTLLYLPPSYCKNVLRTHVYHPVRHIGSFVASANLFCPNPLQHYAFLFQGSTRKGDGSSG